MTLSFFNLCSCNLWWFLLKLAKTIFLPSNALVKCAGLSPTMLNQWNKKQNVPWREHSLSSSLIFFFFLVLYETKSDQERAKPSVSMEKFVASKYHCFYIYRTINKIMWWMHPSLLLTVRGSDWRPSAKSVMSRKLYLVWKWSPIWEIPQ